MSVSDPLIKDLKGLALKLFEENETNGKITDTSLILNEFCQLIELIFYRGAKTTQTGFFSVLQRNDHIDWTYQIAIENENNVLLSYKTIVERLKNVKLCKTARGKFRLLLRHCLMRKCLHGPVEALIKTGNLNAYYSKLSILGDEILATILQSVLMQCNKLNFDLDLTNGSFLDNSWLIPRIVKLELVPCSTLGLGISFSDDRAVIINIDPHSVAYESEKITKGDILDCLNNILINCNCKGRLENIFNLNKGRPINLIIIKAIINEATQEIYPPIRKLLDNLRIDYADVKNNQLLPELSENCETKNDNLIAIKNGKFGYEVVYLGEIDCGYKGSIRQIEEAMTQFLRNNSIMRKDRTDGGAPSWIEIGELGIKVFNCKSGELILNYSFMEISACGSTPNRPNHFAFINGNEYCDSATRFKCHLFFTSQRNDACTILQNIGQGFHRTHFAV